MRKLRPATCLVILGLMLAAMLSVAPAANAATCYGDYCSGQDPQATGCAADAYSFASARIPGTWTYIELRWSPSCKTEWARVPNGYGLYYPNQLSAVQPSTGYRQVGVVSHSADYSWTRQIYSPVRCVYAAWTGPPGSIGTACV